MANRIETHYYTAPSHWAVYLINGDSSGMTDEEIDACDNWNDSLPGFVVDCSDDTEFLTYHDARNFCPYAADCVTYTVHEIK